MPTEPEILDHNPIPPPPPPSSTPSSASLVLEGVLFVTLGCCSILLGSGLFLLVPIGIYVYLLKRHRTTFYQIGANKSFFIGGSWLALPSIPLFTFLFANSGDRFFNPDIGLSLLIALVLSLIFLVIGGAFANLVYLTKKLYQ